MRTKTMRTVLLLISALVVAESTRPCDQSLIKGASLGDLQVSGDSTIIKEMECNDYSQLFKYKKLFKFNSIAYPHITCDASGWKGKGGIEPNPVKLAEADSPLDISCVEYCIPRTGELVTVHKNNDYKDVKTIACSDESFDLYFAGQLVNSNLAFCVPSEGWISGIPTRKSLSKDVFESPQIECRKAPPQCTVQSVDKFHFDDTTKTLTCVAKANSLPMIEYHSRKYSSMICKKINGDAASTTWTWKGEWIAEASPTLSVTCVNYCAATGEGIKSINHGEQIDVTCTDPSHLLLWFDQSYTSENLVRCSLANGWYANDEYSQNGYQNGRRTLSQDKQTPFNFRCKKACTHTLNQKSNYKFVSNKLTCESDSSIAKLKIYHKTYDSLECDMFGGWKNGNDRIQSPLFLLDVDCVNFCTLSGTVSVLTKNGARSNQSIHANCDPNSGILFNSKLYESIDCDEKKGWIARNWTHEYEIAQSNDPIQVSCARFPPSCFKPTATGINFDENNKKLSCGSDKKIAFNSQLYAFLECNQAKGWAGVKAKNTDNVLEYIAEADAQLNVACVEICSATGIGIKVDSLTEHSNSVIVTCPDGQLFYGGNPVGNSAKCNISGGWYGDNKITDDVITPLQFECKSVTTMIPARTTSRLPPSDTTIPTSASDAPLENAEAQNTTAIIVFSFGGILLLAVIAGAVIFMIRKSQKKRAESIKNEANKNPRRDANKDRRGDVANSNSVHSEPNVGIAE